MRRKKPYINNQGSTIIIVLVAVSFIMILATLSLSMSAANVNMKSVERKAKENFYSAEMALDELKANLETELGELVRSVYTNTMIAYSDIPLGQRNEKFKKEFLAEYLSKYDLEGTITTNDLSSNKELRYDCEKLKNLLVKTKPYTDMTNTTTNTLEWMFNSRNTKEQYICFQNVTLKYVGENNYVSRIVTDIKVSIPDLNLETISNIPPFTEYGLIANTKLLVNHANAEVTGNVYAGEEGVVVDGGSTSLIVLANQIITKGAIKAYNGGNITLQDQDGNSNKYSLDVWAANIETDTVSRSETVSTTEDAKTKMELSGNFYISDDTTLNAPNSSVKYSGSYYGYGYGNTAETSSAMILNSKDSTLDLSNIVNLFIAGRAFIEPASGSTSLIANRNGFASKYVRTGEAISTKGNQAIYRLPDECIGVVKKNGTRTSVGTNPLSVEEYQKLLDSKDTLIVDTSYQLPFSNKPLSDYVDAKDPYNIIFDQVNESSYVYFYPNFKDEESANQYFQDYYNSGDSSYREKLLQRMKEYNTTVIAPNNFNSSIGRKTYAGNTVFYDSKGKFVLDNNSVDAELPQQFVDEANDLTQMNKAYCTKLLPSLSGYTDEELKPCDTLFNSLIIYESGEESKPGMKELLGGLKTKVFENAEYGSFLLVDNQSSKQGENTFVLDSTVSDQVRVVIATGDVEVKRDFTGLIISKGTIKLQDGVKVKADAEKVFSLVSNTDIKTVFRDYNSFGTDFKSTQNKEIRMKDLITIENWKKE